MTNTVGVVSPDDHVVEPPDLWSKRLPSRYADVAPRVFREKGRVILGGGAFEYKPDEDGDPVDVWHYEDVRVPSLLTGSAVGYELEEMQTRGITFEDMRPGCYQQGPRLEDMDEAGVEASICFPNMFVRFCGQRFVFATDKDLALLCVQAYNDFILEEWCAGSDERLIPLGILPLWDVQLCAQEMRRLANQGMKAVCFSEIPPYLDLPSIHSDYWDPLFQVVNETSTILMMHIGSGSKLPVTSDDAPAAVHNTLPSINSAMSMVDWLFSGALTKFPSIRLVFAESQIGWVPYFLNRADDVWSHNRGWNEVWGRITDPPSSLFPGRIYLTFFSDDFGLRHLDEIGEDNVMFESDYPHSDSNWPNSLKVGREMTSHLSEELAEKVIRGNARSLFGLV